MAVEADFYHRELGEKIVELEDVILPGTFRNYKDSPGLMLFVNSDNSRSVFELDNIKDVYAIRFLNDADEEGEILDLSTKYIELKKGEDLWIVENRVNRPAREMWFSHIGGNDNENPETDFCLPSNELIGKS